MARTASRVSSDIDFGKDGKQISTLRVPSSSNASAWGTLLIPVVVIKNGQGPTVLFTGGNHGDEFEGPVALAKMVRALEVRDVQGRIIVIPALNLPALRAGERLSPIDGLNMNRAFPGRRDGTITSVIAHYVYTEVLPLADVVVDIHSGGKSMSFVPAGVVHQLPDQSRMADTMALLQAFGAPVGLVLEELDNEGMLDTAVEEMGKLFLSAELGGGGMLSPKTMKIADSGVYNVLRHLGILRADRCVEPASATVLMEVPDGSWYVAASEGGIYEPLVDLGGSLAQGQAVGCIHFLEALRRDPLICVSPHAGTLIGRRIPGRVDTGDFLGLVGRKRDA